MFAFRNYRFLHENRKLLAFSPFSRFAFDDRTSFILMNLRSAARLLHYLFIDCLAGLFDEFLSIVYVISEHFRLVILTQITFDVLIINIFVRMYCNQLRAFM